MLINISLKQIAYVKTKYSLIISALSDDSKENFNKGLHLAAA